MVVDVRSGIKWMVNPWKASPCVICIDVCVFLCMHSRKSNKSDVREREKRIQLMVLVSGICINSIELGKRNQDVERKIESNQEMSER
jgi:hypothetical protein